MKTQSILERFKGNNSIAQFKIRKKRLLTSHMKFEEGEVEASRKGIANTFAKYYGELRASEQAKQNNYKRPKARAEFEAL